VKYSGIRLIAAVAALLLAASLLWSQNNNDSSTPYRTCVFPAIPLSTSDEYKEYQSIISNQLRVELRNAGFKIIPREKWDAVRERQGIRMGQLYQGNVALEVAARVDAEIAVLSFYSVEERQLILEIKCYDVEQKALVAGVFKTARINLSIYNVIGEAVAELIPTIRLLGPPPSLDSPVVEEIALLSKDEGMEVYLGEEGYIGTITDGKLLLPPIPFTIGSRIVIEKRKEGYHTGVETLRLKEPEMLIKLARLRKKALTATELNWTLGQLMGFGLAQRFYLVPDTSFFSAEHYFYLQYNFAGGNPVFHHDLRFLFGGYLFTGPHATFRFNLSTGFGVIVTYFWLPDQPVYSDYYWNLINTTVELNFRRFMLYLRTEQKYALGIGTDTFLERGWMSVFGEGPSTFTFGLAWKW
jgi:hypothetical protein